MSISTCVLLIDDNRMDVELTIDAFREAELPVRVEVAMGGREALEYLFGIRVFADRNRFPLPDLILLDLKMPGIDGFEVLRQIKQTPALRRIPTIVLTSSRDAGDRARSYDHGANSYLLKPVNFAGFIDVVRTLGEYWMKFNLQAPLVVTGG
jgi:CheY-like chemotaxis protein